MTGTQGPIRQDASPPTDTGTRFYAHPRRQLAFSSTVILAALLVLSAIAWIATIQNARSMDMGMGEMSASVGGLGFFLLMWTVMMIAMMFPSVSPMVIAYRRMVAKQTTPWLKTFIFTAGYLVVWAAMGLLAYLLFVSLQRLTSHLGSLGNSLVIGGLLGAAGFYQLSKLKVVCLTHCRGPLAFFFHFREGTFGGFRMGFEHGFYCVGCCWGLMLILFAFGLMNLGWMGAVAALIFVEKVTPIGPRVSKIAGFSMLIAAAVVALLGML